MLRRSRFGTPSLAVGAALLFAVLVPGIPGAAEEGPVERCLDLLRSGRERDGQLSVEARIRPPESADVEDEEGEGLETRLEVTVALDPETRAAREPRLLVSLVSVPIDGEPELWRVERTLELAPGDEVWTLRATVELPEDFVDTAVHVEDPLTGRWGTARVALDGPPAASGLRAAVDEIDEPAPRADEAGAVGSVAAIRLVPPGTGALSGRVRLRALPSSPEVARVDFLVDGAVAASDDKAPFSRAVELGPEAIPRQLEVIAYSGGGRELGRDGLRVNGDGTAFDLRLRRVETETGAVAEAAISVPPGRSLESVDFYRNDAALAKLSTAPYRVPWPTGEPQPGEYLRAVATLDDGTTIEDVLLLDASGPAARVDVNLVEIFAVVTDRSGEPVEGLSREDFSVTQGGRPVDLQRFDRADGLPLSLGLVVDTSESMWPLMLETKQAGAEFLVDTLGDGDRAFLVDFDTRPRLAQGLTPDLRTLLNRFAGLEAGGFTALYDAIVFAMLQFDDGPGRRALVVLTDGDDYRSQFSSGRCIDVGEQLGVPVYFIDLSGVGRAARNGGWQWSGGPLPKLDLDGVSAATGGRVYYISELTELGDAYAEINRELRSQYLLAFATPRNLSPEELQSIEVKVDGRKRLRVRRVVGATAG